MFKALWAIRLFFGWSSDSADCHEFFLQLFNHDNVFADDQVVLWMARLFC